MINIGDKIRVVNAEFTSGLYQNGDVFTVEKILPDGSIYVKEHNKCLWKREFEILDKYFHGQNVVITRQPWEKSLILVPEEFIENRKEKCRYSEEQIEEAKRIIGDIINELGFDYNISFVKKNNKIKVFIGCDDLPFGEHGVASLNPDTIYEESVGKMIALCRATNRELPDWVI